MLMSQAMPSARHVLLKIAGTASGAAITDIDTAKAAMMVSKEKCIDCEV